MKLFDLSFVFRKVICDAQIRTRNLDIRRALCFGSHCAMKLMYQQRPFVHCFYDGEVVTVWRNVGKVLKLIFCWPLPPPTLPKKKVGGIWPS
jgi:hypothetical protein